MIKSAISSSHHYYVIFLESQKIRTCQKLLSIFNVKKEIEKIDSKNKGAELYHIQKELEFSYGSESLLEQNKSKSRNGYYWYDFYVGVADIEKKIFFICYPYSKLGKLIDSFISDQFKERFYIRATVGNVLTYMKDRKRTRISKLEREGFKLDITKYSAEVKEEANANKVSLTGSNPLDSRIYDVLNLDDRITIEPTALKLRCIGQELGDLELSFDRLGNFRFWLKRECETVAIPMIPYVYRFFTEIKAVQTTQYISSQNLLDDES